ncbi:MAG: hypothetical protein QNK37_15335 [Acidobacteriota bacterium]|nr:hypothetical protein [Acidobacteriota bacterium]
MPTSQNKRQKKLAAKKAKRKSRLKKVQTSKIDDLLIEIKRYANGPIHECYISDNIMEGGIGTIAFSRFSVNEPGILGYALILIDSYCLGVKNCVFKSDTIAGFQKTLADCASRETMLPAKPEKAVKLIEGAISFAAAAGFGPHKDYRNIAFLFANIDSSLCKEEFEYGYEGKYFFFQGPHDSPVKTGRILNKLRAKFGVGGFHYTIQAGAEELESVDPPSANRFDT